MHHSLLIEIGMYSKNSYYSLTVVAGTMTLYKKITQNACKIINYATTLRLNRVLFTYIVENS